MGVWGMQSIFIALKQQQILPFISLKGQVANAISQPLARSIPSCSRQIETSSCHAEDRQGVSFVAKRIHIKRHKVM